MARNTLPTGRGLADKAAGRSVARRHLRLGPNEAEEWGERTEAQKMALNIARREQSTTTVTLTVFRPRMLLPAARCYWPAPKATRLPDSQHHGHASDRR